MSDLRSGVGVSYHRNPKIAAKEAIDAARNQAAIDQPDFCMVFATVGYNQTILLETIRQNIGDARLCGCSGEGIIANTEFSESNFAVCVMLIQSDRVRFDIGMVEDIKQDAYSAGKAIGEAIKGLNHQDELALFLFPDGISLNYDTLSQGLEDALGPNAKLPFFGGSSGDNWKFKQTYQYCDDKIASGGISWALMSGDANLAWGVGHGCAPVGIEHLVTKAEGNALLEFDGRPVLDVVREDYLSEEDLKDWSKTFQVFTLGLKAPEDLENYDPFIIRSIVGGIDQDKGTITIGTDVEEGTHVWIASRDLEKLRLGNDHVLTNIQEHMIDAPIKIAFRIECIGRGKVFVPESVRKELTTTIQERIGENTPTIGFFSYGEIGAIGLENHFHNESMVFLVVQ